MPGLQSVQLSVPTYLPTGQFVQLDAPVLMAAEPSGQFLQSPESFDPTVVEYVPATQLWQKAEEKAPKAGE